MAEQAERLCAVCERPIDLPRQTGTADGAICSNCLQLRHLARASEDTSIDEDLEAQTFERVDYDVHAPGLMTEDQRGV